MSNSKNIVLIVSLAITIIIVISGAFFPAQFSSVADFIYSNFVNRFSWFYMLAMLLFIIFCIYLLISKKRNIVLGKDGEAPEYSLKIWFAMLFSTGMGVGLIFWGAAEPMSHFVNPIEGIEPGSQAAKQFAFRTSFLHWGITPWANYIILSLGLAYMQFRKGKKGLISSIFIPLFGDDFNDRLGGKIIDIIAVFATVAGIATSLGLGSLQINSALNYLFGIPETELIVSFIIIIVTAAFILSAVVGIDKGISTLSNINIIIAVILMAIFFVIGPTRDILINLGEGIKNYLINLPQDSIPIIPEEKKEWIGSWTIFYWAWWIAWAPFVSTFIARISRGRTIKEFIIGALIAPPIISFLWFSVFGTMGINLSFSEASEAVENVSLTFFKVLEHYPLTDIFSIFTGILIFIFLVTSADSGTFVLGMFNSRGNQNPTNKMKVMWGVIITAVTIVLLTTSDNGLQMLQTISLAAALPIGIVMIMALFAIYKSLKYDSGNKKREKIK